VWQGCFPLIQTVFAEWSAITWHEAVSTTEDKAQNVSVWTITVRYSGCRFCEHWLAWVTAKGIAGIAGISSDSALSRDWRAGSPRLRSISCKNVEPNLGSVPRWAKMRQNPPRSQLPYGNPEMSLTHRVAHRDWRSVEGYVAVFAIIHVSRGRW